MRDPGMGSETEEEHEIKKKTGEIQTKSVVY